MLSTARPTLVVCAEHDLRCRRRANQWLIRLLALSLWVAQPFLMANYLILTQQLNWYPTNADSIGIPLAGGYAVAVLGSPIWIWICRANFRTVYAAKWLFSPQFPILRRHKVRSAVLGCLICLTLKSAQEGISLWQELGASRMAEYAYFGICHAGAAFGWALVWWCMLHQSEPEVAGPVVRWADQRH